MSEDVIEEMCTRLMRLGMSREEILSAVQEWAGEASGETKNI